VVDPCVGFAISLTGPLFGASRTYSSGLCAIRTACSSGFMQYLNQPFGHIEHDIVAARHLVGAPALLPRARQAGVEIRNGDAGRPNVGPAAMREGLLAAERGGATTVPPRPAEAFKVNEKDRAWGRMARASRRPGTGQQRRAQRRGVQSLAQAYVFNVFGRLAEAARG
jgi:hypothetical protein